MTRVGYLIPNAPVDCPEFWIAMRTICEVPKPQPQYNMWQKVLSYYGVETEAMLQKQAPPEPVSPTIQGIQMLIDKTQTAREHAYGNI